MIKYLKKYRSNVVVEGLIFALLVFFAVLVLRINPGLFFPILILLFAIPIILFHFYKITDAKKITLSRFHTKGIVYRLFSRRTFRYAFWIIFGPIITAYTLIKLYGFTLNEWIILFLLIPLFKLLYRLIKKQIEKELKAPYINIYALRYTVIISSMVMAILFPALVYISGEYDFSQIQSFDDAVSIQFNQYSGLSQCPIAYALASKIAFVNGIVIYFLSLLSGKWLIFAILATAGEGLVFFALSSIFALYLLRHQNISAALFPMHDAKELKHPYFKPVLISIIGLFIFAASYILLNQQVEQNQSLKKALSLPQEIAVEIVDGKYLTAGSISKLNQLKQQLKEEIGKRVNRKIDLAFDKMIDNVDNYLDWYYGLSAEYLRTIKFITGGLQNFVKTNLAERLKQGGAEKLIRQTIAEVPRLVKKSREKFNRMADEIIKKNIVKPKPFDKIVIRKQQSIKQITGEIKLFNDAIPHRTRLGLSVSIGLITGIIVKRIVSKSAYRISIKLLTRLLGKKVVSRWVGTGTGAAAGAGIGSSVPGAGTIIGTIIGAGIGFIASIFIDYSVLKLEEQLNRENYKRQIINGINESRRQFKKWQF